MYTASMLPSEAATELDSVLRDGSVTTHFQPIVDLETANVVGFEALSRGPVGPLQSPDMLFTAARAAGRLAELDALCRRTAVHSAVRAGINAPATLFVNVEPEVLETARFDDLIAVVDAMPTPLQVVLEITERAIAARPADLLATVQRLRRAGWRIALDDVGADDMSLAFMPLLLPDVVKLDLRLVQRRPGPAVAEIMNAVNAYAERTGAVLLAEGIEDETHLGIARALGARLGQGWMFGRPSPVVATALPSGSLHLPARPMTNTVPSPFTCVPEDVPVRTSTKPLLVEVSKHLEREAIRFGETCLVLATFQEAKHFTPATARRYSRLQKQVGFVAAIGAGLSDEPVPGVRGADLRLDDPVRGEWDLVVLAPHFAGALLARDLGDLGPDEDRRFEFVLTYDREVVTAAAQTLMSRVLPQDAARTALQSAPRSGAAAVGRDALQVLRRHTDTGDSSDVTLRRALAATTNGVTIADISRPDHPLVYVNAAFEKLSGLRAGDVLGRNCRFLQGPATDPEIVGRLREAVAGGREIRETLANYRGDEREEWWNEIYLTPIHDERGRMTHYIGIQSDVTSRVLAERELEQERLRSLAYLREVEDLAFRDPLTGLLNRRRLQEALPAVIAHAERERASVAVVYLDLDDFKSINDRNGHAVGDAVLRATGDRLRERLRPMDLIARMGGDEFLVVLPDLDVASGEQRAERVAADLVQRLGAPIESPVPGAHPVHASVSVGVSMFPRDGSSFDELVHAADQRMYANKSAVAVAEHRSAERQARAS